MNLKLIICILLTSALCYSQLDAPSYKCDDVVDLSICKNLRMTKGSFQLRGLIIVYYIYEASNQQQDMDPLILIHGGPAASHLYMEPMKQIACYGRKVIMYDQAGCGESSRPQNITEDAPWLLTIPYYIEELQTLVDHLGLKSYHILGHSWGTVVALQYALVRPVGMKGLVLAGAVVDAQFYINEQKRVRQGTLPTYLQKTIAKLESEQAYDSELYQLIGDHLTGFWTVRQFPIPDCVQQAIDQLNQEIYVKVQGPSEFTIGGILKHYNETSRLHEVQYRTLVTGGQYDTMVETTLYDIQRNMPQCEVKLFQRCGHMTMVDEPNDYNQQIQEFLSFIDRVEREKVLKK